MRGATHTWTPVDPRRTSLTLGLSGGVLTCSSPPPGNRGIHPGVSGRGAVIEPLCALMVCGWVLLSATHPHTAEKAEVRHIIADSVGG